MKAVLQRALRASVTVGGEVVGEINRPGLVALVGVHREDTVEDAEKLARRIATLRILEDEQSLESVGAPVLVISQFTLQARTKKGTRPSWSDAAPGPVAEPLVEAVVEALRQRGIETATGRFGAMMDVALINNGPVTLIVDTR
ncbi:D-aminoacyl-tRNA deacylase [Actinomyces minihominis]|uniref:D-aminoacyl-tRNA deacylase n=1 Tax=Actinomyces minihominis TaxID=2002838 RepID=UPI000C06EF73|nr:D-aminoacyl-tRNA deacylase [Actinomyces minihominis]